MSKTTSQTRPNVGEDEKSDANCNNIPDSLGVFLPIGQIVRSFRMGGTVLPTRRCHAI